MNEGMYRGANYLWFGHQNDSIRVSGEVRNLVTLNGNDKTTQSHDGKQLLNTFVEVTFSLSYWGDRFDYQLLIWNVRRDWRIARGGGALPLTAVRVR